MNEDSTDPSEIEESKEENLEENRYLSISVTDTGCGMTDQKKSSCFKLNNGLTAAQLLCKSL